MSATMLFNNLITFSRGSNATVVGPNGLVQWAPNNLLTFSEQFDNAAWGKTNATITANSTAAPDGATTADTLVEDTTNGAHGVSSPNATVALGPVTWSVYVKAGTRSWVWINAFAGGNNRTWFNLANGTVGTTGAGATASITSVGNGWYRCSVTLTSGTTTVSMGINAASADNTTSYAGTTSAPAILIWGAQLELGTAATTYNSTSVKNLLGFSEAFDNAAWTKTRASIVTGAAANPINGLFNAQKLMEDTTASNSHFVVQNSTAIVANTRYVQSVYAKAGERSWLYMTEGNNVTAQAWFDIANGVVGNVTGTGSPAGSITAVGNGWYRCSLAFTPIAAAANVQLRVTTGNNVAIYTGDGNSGIYIYGAQLSDSASLDPYVPTPGAAPSSTAYYGPRFDYDPVTLAAKGLLIEEQRANLETYSEQFDNAVWTKTGAGTGSAPVVTANQATSPDGTANADLVVFNAGSNGAGDDSTLQGASFTATAQPYTFSVWIKTSDGSSKTLRISISGAGASTITATGTWQRFTTTWTATAGVWNPRISVGNGATGATASVYLWGAQVEAGSFATSYIPTVASTVTRSADVATMTGANFSSWYNQNAGSFVVKADSAVGTSLLLYSPASVTDGTGNNLIRGYIYNGSRGFSVTVGGASQADMAAAGYSSGVVGNWGFGYQPNDFALSVNGSSPATDTSGTVPVVDRLFVGGINSGNQLNGHVRSIAYYPDRLSNTQLQSLTT